MQNIEQYSVSLFGPDNNSIFTVFIILGIIVIVCLFIVIFTFICYKKIHSYNIEQIVYLSLSTIILILGYIFGWDNKDNSKMCQSQAIMIIIGEMSQYFWSTLIIYTLYDTLYNFEHASKASVMKRRIIHFLIGFGIPIIIAIIATICTFTGKSDQDYWCSIQSKPFLIVLFVIIWLSIFLNMYLLFKVKSFFKILLLKEERHIVNKDLQKLTCYPIIQMIAVLPDSLGKLIMLLKYDEKGTRKIIQTITLIVTLLQGLCIAIIFGAVSNVLKRLFCCKKEKVEISEIENTKEIVDTPKKKNNMKSSFLDVFDGDGKEVISEGDVESGGLMY